MANELLDFVMALVRDPDAAARYAADPATALADAHLTNVTSADVNNLIPVVSDSLSMAAPAFGGSADPNVADGNVWTSGAATAAFDSFAPHVPDQAMAGVHDVSTGVIDTSALPGADAGTVPGVDATDSSQLSDLIGQHSATAYDALNEVVTDGPTTWEDGLDHVTDLHHDLTEGGHDSGTDHSGFDFFS